MIFRRVNKSELSIESNNNENMVNKFESHYKQGGDLKETHSSAVLPCTVAENGAWHHTKLGSFRKTIELFS